MGEVQKVTEAVQRLEVNEPVVGREDNYEDEDEDEDEDENEDEPPVLIGFVEKPSQPWSLARELFPSKAGGAPAWLDPIHLPTGTDISCGVCEKPLQFLLQVYAPIDGRAHVFHRTLFVFICPNMACLQHHQRHQIEGGGLENLRRSVKVFRCQLNRENEYYSIDPPKNDGHDAPLGKGVSLCSWCGTWKGEKVCSICTVARYCSRTHQLEHWRASHGEVCKVKTLRNEGDSLKDEVKSGWASPASNKLWREFEIVEEEEGSDEDEPTRGSMALVPNEKDDDISKQFLEVETSQEQQQWASVQARLSRAPGQILRYCRSQDAKPLWLQVNGKPDVKSIPACSSCNCPRIFEFQILPQLLYYFRAANEPDSLDWGTIAIYSCEGSCTSSRAYIEEFAWVQLA